MARCSRPEHCDSRGPIWLDALAIAQKDEQREVRQWNLESVASKGKSQNGSPKERSTGHMHAFHCLQAAGVWTWAPRSPAWLGLYVRSITTTGLLKPIGRISAHTLSKQILGT